MYNGKENSYEYKKNKKKQKNDRPIPKKETLLQQWNNDWNAWYHNVMQEGTHYVYS